MRGKKILNFSIIAIPFTVLVLVLFTGVIPASANVACGATLTTDITLTHNLSCTTTPGLIIGANDITIDLNGHTITGLACSSCHGIRNVGFDGVTIKDGVIIGFEQGIRAEGVSDLKLKGLTLLEQTSSHAIDILDSEKVEIKDSFISIPTTTFIGPEAIRLESVDNVKVKGVTIIGGFVGVNFACGDCDGEEPFTNGKIEKSTIVGTFIGVLIANSEDAKIKKNTIADGVTVVCPAGFCADVPITLDSKGISIDFLSNTGTEIKDNEIFANDGFGIRAIDADDLKIEKNFIHTNTLDGIKLVNVDDSKISKNDVTNNDDRGIALESDSTDNEITKNTAGGNTGDDLTQDVTSSPNDWEDNTCDDSDDAGSGEIDCP